MKPVDVGNISWQPLLIIILPLFQEISSCAEEEMQFVDFDMEVRHISSSLTECQQYVDRHLTLKPCTHPAVWNPLDT